jgi:DNA-binding NtrC family response regulator
MQAHIEKSRIEKAFMEVARAMTEIANDGNFQPLGIDDEIQRSSPARRVAAYHQNIELVGRSQAFTEVIKQIGRVSNTHPTVLLTGEAGTGKGLVASAIHHRSDRADKPFVAVNCGAFAAELLEAEVFGNDRPGLWEEADGGTLFLEEITETTASFQAKLLQALQSGEIRRAGANHTLKVNARVIAASNRNVEQEVNAGRFHKELFYRLNAVSIGLPPLRERPEDIPPLAQGFADRIFSLSPPVKFSAEALALMERYSWPGNIRELENVVVRGAAICDGTIRPKDLPERVRNYTQKNTDNGAWERNGTAETPRKEWVPLSVVEGRYVEEVLKHTGGNKQAAARLLVVDRKTLDRMIKRHHIDCERVRRAAR